MLYQSPSFDIICKKGSNMAMKKVSCAGSTIKIKANGGANTEETVPCIKGEFTYSYGKYEVEESSCSDQGTTYDKADKPKWGYEIKWDMYFTGDKTDAFQKLLFEALHNEGDFVTDRGLHITIEYPDVDANKVEIDVFVTEMESKFTPTGKLNIVATLHQIGLGVKLVMS